MWSPKRLDIQIWRSNWNRRRRKSSFNSWELPSQRFKLKEHWLGHWSGYSHRPRHQNNEELSWWTCEIFSFGKESQPFNLAYLHYIMCALLCRSHLRFALESYIPGIYRLIPWFRWLKQLVVVQLYSNLASSIWDLDHSFYKHGSNLIARNSWSCQVLASLVYKLGYWYIWHRKRHGNNCTDL